MRRGSPNADIHTLVQELRDKVYRYNSQKSQDSRELTIGFIKSIWEMNKSVLTVASITRRDIRLLWHIIIYQKVSESYEMRQEQVKNVWDEMNIPFSLSSLSHIMLFRQEIKPGIVKNRSKIIWKFISSTRIKAKNS